MAEPEMTDEGLKFIREEILKVMVSSIAKAQAETHRAVAVVKRRHQPRGDLLGVCCSRRARRVRRARSEKCHPVGGMDGHDPIEIGDFVSAFTSVSSQYSRFIKDNYPQLSPDARIFVKEIEKGSIIADLIPFAPLLGLSDYIPLMQQADVITKFVESYGSKISSYFTAGEKIVEPTRADLQDFLDSVAAIANDSNGKSQIAAAVFEDGKKEIRTAFTFTTAQARTAVKSIEAHRAQLDRKGDASHERGLMVFTLQPPWPRQFARNAGRRGQCGRNAAT